MDQKSFEILKNQDRPNSIEYINMIFKDFVPLCGDRLFGDDSALVGGIALLDNSPVTVLGQLRGHTLKENLDCNFSMMRPSGYRKAQRLMKLSEKFRWPIICFVDTYGADPSISSEQHNQANAIATLISEALFIKTPIISLLIGHGGSGGALALAIADRLAILENATFSVISPKAYAEIMWKDVSKELKAATELQMDSAYLLEKKIVHKIIMEPDAGAQINKKYVADLIKVYICEEIKHLRRKCIPELIFQRHKQYQRMVSIHNHLEKK